MVLKKSTEAAEKKHGNTLDIYRPSPKPLRNNTNLLRPGEGRREHCSPFQEEAHTELDLHKN